MEQLSGDEVSMCKLFKTFSAILLQGGGKAIEENAPWCTRPQAGACQAAGLPHQDCSYFAAGLAWETGPAIVAAAPQSINFLLCQATTTGAPRQFPD